MSEATTVSLESGIEVENKDCTVEFRVDDVVADGV